MTKHYGMMVIHSIVSKIATNSCHYNKALNEMLMYGRVANRERTIIDKENSAIMKLSS
jgi:hypothetical protein